ncbi:hypothetical protein PX554_15385 [Sphingomonas sp. H39-1-10]|uniref:hypothetical protein n=1 Tax=Sphingomonas TaxID=13687 RepID=UPI00089128EA|nr:MULTISPECIES: hypothetical protein [Sphingomonas]MDF0489519.1 hypothetical protein [Sphingomonas pollutisoli]SDA28867.1 hypothetical protein SAMN03159340_02271 [Sphingomonas sp. NFR15]
MATTPPTELPPQPTQPGTPETPPPEVTPTTPDIDVPAPMPTSDPAVAPGQPTDLGDFA